MLPLRKALLRAGFLTAGLALAASAATPTLRVGCDEDHAPYSTRDAKGNPVGFAVDVLREALGSAGYQGDFRIDHGGFLILGARSNRYDVIITTLPAQRDLLASRPFHTDQPVVYARVGTRFESLTEGGSITQRGAIVRAAVPVDRIGSTGLREHPLPLGSARIAMQLLADGDVAYVVIDRLAAVTALRDYRIAGVAPLLQIEKSPMESRFHLAPPHTNLLAQLDEGLLAMERDGRLDRIYRQWFGVSEPQPMTLQDLRPYVPALLLTIVLIACLHLWRLEKKTLALRDAVQAREKAQLALQASEERFRQIAENVQEVFWTSDVQKTRIEYVSPGYERIWGRSAQELLAHPHELA
jgi:ABC-type amino acid transport substrate-binding protein